MVLGGILKVTLWAELAKLHSMPFSNRLKVLIQHSLNNTPQCSAGWTQCKLHTAGTSHCKTCNVQCALYNVHRIAHCHMCVLVVLLQWDFHMLHSSHISHFAQCDKTSHTFVQFAQSVTGVLLVVDATNSSVRDRQTSLSAPLCDSLHSVTNNTLQFAVCTV